jgi:protein subunit release factor A
MKQLIIEIRSGEGGKDANLLVKDMMNVYIKSAKNQNFDFKIEEKEGYASI